jgi:hypothetical protein
MSVTINRKSKAVWEKNLWGQEYRAADILLEGYEVNGGLFCQSSHATLAGAIKEKEQREQFNKRHPFDMPMSQREKEKAAEHGLTWDRFLCEWVRIQTGPTAPLLPLNAPA